MENLVIAVLVILVLVLFTSMHRTLVYRFYRPTCGYCVSSQADWDSFKRSNMLSMVSCKEINMDDASESDRKLADNFGVSGVPAVFAVKSDGRRFKHEGERTVEGYNLWLAML